jgi:hypothetical protein
VSHLDQVQDDAEPLCAWAWEAARTRHGRGGQLPDRGWRAVVDARGRESGSELGMAEQDLPGHRCQEHVDLPGIAPDSEREDVHAQELRGEWPQRAAQRIAEGLERHRLVQVPFGRPPVEVAKRPTLGDPGAQQVGDQAVQAVPPAAGTDGLHEEVGCG